MHQQKPQPIKPKPSTVNTNLDLEETTKNFNKIKISSSNNPSTKQMMYKKNTATKSTITDEPTNNESNSKVKKTRSRSHSRGKVTNYIATAATAINGIISAIKTSPNTTKLLNSITNQANTIVQFPTQASTPVVETIASNSAISSSTSSETCYEGNNILFTSTSYNSNQSIANFIDGRPIKTCVPSRSDFFIWYSSVRGFVSHRDVDGSPFIRCLVTVLSRCAYELELLEMVRKVNCLMQQYEKIHLDERNATAYYLTVPVAEYHLTKGLYFNP